MSLDTVGFSSLIDDLVKSGVSEEKAPKYAALIGDCYITDVEGKVLVYEDGVLIDRVTNPYS